MNNKCVQILNSQFRIWTLHYSWSNNMSKYNRENKEEEFRTRFIAISWRNRWQTPRMIYENAADLFICSNLAVYLLFQACIVEQTGHSFRNLHWLTTINFAFYCSCLVLLWVAIILSYVALGLYNNFWTIYLNILSGCRFTVKIQKCKIYETLFLVQSPIKLYITLAFFVRGLLTR